MHFNLFTLEATCKTREKKKLSSDDLFIHFPFRRVYILRAYVRARLEDSNRLRVSCNYLCIHGEP